MERRQRQDFGQWDGPGHGADRSHQLFHQENIAYPGTGPPAELPHGGGQPLVHRGIRDHQQRVSHQEYDQREKWIPGGNEQRLPPPGGMVSENYYLSQSIVGQHGGGQSGIPSQDGYRMGATEQRRFQQDVLQSGVPHQGHSSFGRHEGPQCSDMPPHRGPGLDTSKMEGAQHRVQQSGVLPHGGSDMSRPELRRFQHNASQTGISPHEHVEHRSIDFGVHEQRSDLPEHRGLGPETSRMEGAQLSGQQLGILPHVSRSEPRSFHHNVSPLGTVQQGPSEYRNSGFGVHEQRSDLPEHRRLGPETSRMEGAQLGIPPHVNRPEPRSFHHNISPLGTTQQGPSEYRNSGFGGHEGQQHLHMPPQRGPGSDTSKMEEAQLSGQQPGILPLMIGPELRRFHHDASQPGVSHQGHSEHRSSAFGGHDWQHSDLPPHRGPGPGTSKLEVSQYSGKQHGIPSHSSSPMSGPEPRRFQHDALQSGVSHHGRSEYRSSSGKPHLDLTPHSVPGPDTYKVQGAQHSGASQHGSFHMTPPDLRRFQHNVSQSESRRLQHDAPQSKGIHPEHSEYRNRGFGLREEQRSDLPPHRDFVPDTNKMEGAQHNSKQPDVLPHSGPDIVKPEPKLYQQSGVFHHGQSQARGAGFGGHEGCPDTQPHQVPRQGQVSGVPPHGGFHKTGPELFHHGQSQPGNADFVVPKGGPNRLPHRGSMQDINKVEGSQLGDQHFGAPHHGVSHIPGPLPHTYQQSGSVPQSQAISIGKQEVQHPGVPLHVLNPPQAGENKQGTSSFGAPKPDFFNPATSINRPPVNEIFSHTASPSIVQPTPAPFQPGSGQSIQYINHPAPGPYFPPPFPAPLPSLLLPPPPPQTAGVCSGPHREDEPHVSHLQVQHPEMQKEKQFENVPPFGLHREDMHQDVGPRPACEIMGVQNSNLFISQTNIQRPDAPFFQQNLDAPRDARFNSHAIFCDQPENINSNRPSDMLEGTGHPSHKDIFQNWLSNFLAFRKKKSSVKPDSIPSTPISEARKLIYGALHLVSQLSALCQTLEDTMGEEQSWVQQYEKAADIRVELERRMQELEKPGYIQCIKNKLDRVRKKRLRCQQKKIIKEEEEKEAADRAAEKETRIDRWRMQRIQEVEEKKKERELKAVADSVLGEVRKKQTDARKMLDVLKSLEKLRKLRKEAAARKGVSPPPAADKTFKNHINRLRTMVHKRVALYDVEERALRVIVEGEQEEERQREKEKRLRKEKEKFLQKQRALDSLLFGDDEPLPGLHPLQPFRQYYLQAENSVVSLVQIRHTWDQFLAPPDHPDASSIPRGWVLPMPPSSDIWATALKQLE